MEFLEGKNLLEEDKLPFIPQLSVQKGMILENQLQIRPTGPYSFVKFREFNFYRLFFKITSKFEKVENKTVKLLERAKKQLK